MRDTGGEGGGGGGGDKICKSEKDQVGMGSPLNHSALVVISWWCFGKDHSCEKIDKGGVYIGSGSCNESCGWQLFPNTLSHDE